MSEPAESTRTQVLSFVTIKVACGLSKTEVPYGIFDHREFCDQFIRSIIYCIENTNLHVYGFVIISDQIHLIVSSEGHKISDKIGVLKKVSAREIIIQVGKKLNGLDADQSRNHKELRWFFNQFLNSDETSFWQKDDSYQVLKIKGEDMKIEAISSSILIAHLADNKRNYLQLGANAFTKLMMETMKI